SIQFAGPALPLSVLLALIGCVCVAASIGQLAKEMPSAGGLYTYVARSLGPQAGFVVGWAYLLFEPLVAPLLFLIFAWTTKGMVFAVLAFIGFESSAPLGEEARNPRWTVPRAVVGSAIGIGLFYVFCSYAWVIGTGFDHFTQVATASANPWRDLGIVFWSGG